MYAESASAAGPEVVAVFAPHASTRTTTTYGYSWHAGHLGPQWDDQHIPIIMAGPGIIGARHSDYPARLVDIAPTVERLLSAPSGRVDGVILHDVLWQSSEHNRIAQSLRKAQLMF